MGAPRFIWTVYGFAAGAMYRQERVASFFEWSDAADFVSANHAERDLYISEPKYDRRADGYRPVVKPSGYREWLASLEPKAIGNGRFQVAA